MRIPMILQSRDAAFPFDGAGEPDYRSSTRRASQ